MRSSILFTAAFAATALAKPVFDKRGEVVVTDNELVYVTEVVTVTAGDEPIAAATVAPTKARGYGGWGRNKKHRHTRTGGSAAPAPTSEAPAPAPSSEEPAPAPTSEAPAPTSEAPAPAPTSYDEPAPAPSTSEAPAPAPSAPANTGVATDYKSAVVQHHNFHRANHSAPDLAWSDSLAATAKKIALSCKFAHDMTQDGGNYGQNIAAGVDASEVASIISDMFYNGEAGSYTDYYGVADGPPNPPNDPNSPFMKVGHFTQLVWASTKNVGCATVDCSTQSAGSVYTNQGGSSYGPSKMNSFTVCNYSPPGNFGGEYANNVGKPLGQPIITGMSNVESVDKRKTDYISP